MCAAGASRWLLCGVLGGVVAASTVDAAHQCDGSATSTGGACDGRDVDDVKLLQRSVVRPHYAGKQSATAAARRSLPPSEPLDGDYVNVCYFTNWARYRQNLINEGKDVFEMGLPADMCTHFMYGFATVFEGANGYELKSNDPNADHPSGSEAQDGLCPEACDDPDFVPDWNDPDGVRCDWPCDEKRIMRGYEALTVGMKRHNPSIKGLISVGGWNFNDCRASAHATFQQGTKTCEIFSTIARSEEETIKFAHNIIAFCRKWGFDGFDLDWEYPVAAGHNKNNEPWNPDGEFPETPEDFQNYITMLRLLKEEFHKENPASPLLLTAAVGVGKATVEVAYNIREMSEYLDMINLMTYDLHGAWENRTGCNANLYATEIDAALGGGVGAGEAVEDYPLSVSWAVDYWITHGASPSKLTMGLATYGRGWKLTDPLNVSYNAPTSGASTPGISTGEAGYKAYYEIEALIASNQATRYYDGERMCPYIVTTDGEWIGYDDLESYEEKLKYVAKSKLMGTMVWALDLDDFANGYPLIDFARQYLKQPTPPPTPSPPTLAPVTSPTPVPVTSPTPAPVTSPTPAPVTSPTPAPVSPTPAPPRPSECGTCTSCVFPTGCFEVPDADYCHQWPDNVWCGDDVVPTPVPATSPTPAPMSSPTPAPMSSPTPAPMSSPTLAPSPTPPPPASKKKMMLFLENWLACPSMDVVQHYTHIIISFAVTYTWNQAKNICSETCALSPVAVCGNAPNVGLIRQWQQAGIKVLLSFGGAGMGGSWAGDVNDCWEYCFGRGPQLSNDLMAIVNEMSFDGVDIDYEYHHTAASSQFLKVLNTNLGGQLHAAGKTLSHAPMDGDISAGNPYFTLLQETASYVDYLLPQYYNGPFRPATSMEPVLPHMGNLIDDIFNGDQSRVVFGFCATDCSGTGSNIDGATAVDVLKQVQPVFPAHGGAFLWAGAAERQTHWSNPVYDYFASLAPSGPTPAPVTSPTPSPSPKPPTPAPATPSDCGTCTSCVFANGGCYEVPDADYCTQWPGNVWCGS